MVAATVSRSMVSIFVDARLSIIPLFAVRCVMQRWLLLLVMAVRSAAAAQTPTPAPPVPVITPDSRVDTPTLHAWLHSGDPRLVAWASVFAERTHDAVIVSEIPNVLYTWVLPLPSAPGEPNASQRRAAMAMLDTLIVEGGTLPPNTLQVVGQALPSQALLLAARMPEHDSEWMLIQWATDRAASGWTGQTLARVSAMLLAKPMRDARPDPGATGLRIVFGTVSLAEDEVEVHVRASSRGLGYGAGGGGCGDSMARPVNDGWPEVYTYSLGESFNAAQQNTLIALDNDSIIWNRHKENGGFGSCSGVEPLDAATRHRMLAYWLGIDAKQMPWSPFQQREILWHSQAEYELQLGRIVDGETWALRGTAQALYAKGLLSSADTATPLLRIKVLCDMDPCPIH